jgi:hypothetical protein
MHNLALSRGKIVIDLPTKPFNAEPGFRYLGMLPTPERLIHHVVAIDEAGVVFDPDPAMESSRRNWKECEFMAMLEFRPV